MTVFMRDCQHWSIFIVPHFCTGARVQTIGACMRSTSSLLCCILVLCVLVCRTVTIYRSIDSTAAIRRFRRYHDTLPLHYWQYLIHAPVMLVKVSVERLFERFGSFQSCWRQARTTGSWRAATVASAEEIAEELERVEATERCKNGNMIAFRLPCCRRKLGEQQGSQMLARWTCCEMQWQHYLPDSTYGQVACVK